MNVRLLRKIQKHILEEPKRFKMSSWVTRKEDGNETAYDTEVANVKEWKFAKCGTAACIGGWAIILSGKLERARDTCNYGRMAGKLLEIDHPSENLLFGLCSWPEEYRDKFVNAKTLRARAQAAVARIDHFIKTKGAE